MKNIIRLGMEVYLQRCVYVDGEKITTVQNCAIVWFMGVPVPILIIGYIIFIKLNLFTENLLLSSGVSMSSHADLPNTGALLSSLIGQSRPKFSEIST